MKKKEKSMNRIYKLITAVLLTILGLILYLNQNDDSQYIQSQNIARKQYLKQKVLKPVNKFQQLLNDYCDPVIIEQNNNCLKQIKNYKPESNCTKNELTYHHTFWQLKSSSLDQFDLRVLELNLMSYLATQNLACTKFILWKLEEFPLKVESYLRNRFAYYFDNKQIDIKTLDITSMCSSESQFVNHIICKEKKNRMAYKQLVALSDFVRFFVLDLYGGIYTDGDVIYLKDMQPFWTFNFAYRWSFVEKLNTAVLGIKKKDLKIKDLYNKIISKSRTLNALIANFHPDKISSDIKTLNSGNVFDYEPLRVLSGFLFDAAWLCFDEKLTRVDDSSVCYFSEFTTKQLIEANSFKPGDFFAGAYTYHLHLKRSKGVISPTSYFSYFEKYYYSVLKLNLK